MLEIIAQLCGGIGLFLIGMILMTDSLKEMAVCFRLEKKRMLSCLTILKFITIGSEDILQTAG